MKQKTKKMNQIFVSIVLGIILLINAVQNMSVSEKGAAEDTTHSCMIIS